MRHGEYEQSSDDMIDEICRTGASGHDAASRGELEAALAPPLAPRKTKMKEQEPDTDGRTLKNKINYSSLVRSRAAWFAKRFEKTLSSGCCRRRATARLILAA